jgi:hypothetical protein
MVQDLFGHFIVTIPYDIGHCATVKIPKLDNKRVIDAWSRKDILLVLYEENGDTHLATIKFDKRFTTHTIHIDNNTGLAGINATMKQNGTVVMDKGDELEIFLDPGKKVVMQNNPVNDNSLYAYNDVYFTEGSKLYIISKK